MLLTSNNKQSWLWVFLMLFLVAAAVVVLLLLLNFCFILDSAIFLF